MQILWLKDWVMHSCCPSFDEEWKNGEIKSPGMSEHGWPLINVSDCTWFLSESWTGTRKRQSRFSVEWPPGHHFKQYCAGTVVCIAIADSSRDAFPRRAGCLTLNLLTPKYFTRKEQLYPVKLRKTRDFISNVTKVILFQRNLRFWYLSKEAETCAFLKDLKALGTVWLAESLTVG